MFNNVIFGRVAAAAIRIYDHLMVHRSNYEAKHIGAFAGSYLAHGDWNHK